MDVRADDGSVIAKQFRTAVNPSMEAAGKTSLFCTLRNLSFDHVATVQTTRDVCTPATTSSATAHRGHALQREFDARRARHASSTWRASRHNQFGREPSERDREADFRIVKNRRFLPKAPGTDLRRSEKCLAITIDRTFRAVICRKVAS
jgi:hypothetical protein